MSSDEMQRLILKIIEKAKNGLQVEENKIELKNEWYNFDDKGNKKKVESEFLKDMTAIANCFGPEGYLIIGINEKTGETKNSPFRECGLRDLTEIRNLVVKNVDKPYDFEYQEVQIEDSIIGIFSIPPSIEKPHIIKYFISKKDKEIEQYIPIKKATGIFPSTRADIELMYYDRKNIAPEYDLDLIVYQPNFNFYRGTQALNGNFQLAFQNNGTKPIAIVKLTFTIVEFSSPECKGPIHIDINRYDDFIPGKNSLDSFSNNFLVIPSNSVKNILAYFDDQSILKSVPRLIYCLQYSGNSFIFHMVAKDIRGKIYQSQDYMHQN